MSDLEKQLNLLKYYICEMCYLANSGHPSSSLSCSDIIGTLYFEIMDISKDKFILSKGHAVPALYSALMVNNTISKDLINKLKGSIDNRKRVLAINLIGINSSDC